MIIIIQQQKVTHGTNPEHKTGVDLIYESDINIVANRQKNIYDLAGNVAEWTMEAYGNSRIARGGSFFTSGSQNPAADRYDHPTDGIYDRIGFRIALYLNEEESWSSTYDTEGTYQDKNGDEAYIPKGFQVSRKPGETTIDEGLVIKNEQTNDEYVWIEVPKSVYVTVENSEDYTNIESDLRNYTKIFRNDDTYLDTWYSQEQHGLTEQKYNELKNKMYKSIYEKGGFYIGRYETGIETARNENVDTLPQAVIQKDMYPYNNVTCKQAQTLAEGFTTEDKTSSLMFGIQWDLVLKHITEKESKLGLTRQERQEKIRSNSTDWGNYMNSKFTIARGKYSILNSSEGTLGDWNDTNYIEKSENTSVILSTGATDRNSVLNIYDLAGNVWEYTLENTGDSSNLCGRRGGNYNSNGNSLQASCREGVSTSDSNSFMGFRVTIY